MCYKIETMKKGMDKLQRKLNDDGVPEFIRRFFMRFYSQNTAINYWVAIRNFLVWSIERNIINRNCISEILPDDMLLIEDVEIKRYFDEKESEGSLAPTSLKVKKDILSSFWEYLCDTNYCPVKTNVVKKVHNVGTSYNSQYNIIEKCPTDQEVEDMEYRISMKRDPFIRNRNLYVLRVLKGTGIRESEIAGLDIEDVNFTGDEWGGPYIEILGKGSYKDYQKRRVYLTCDAKEAFEEWLKIRSTVNIVDQDAMFLAKNGKRLTAKNIAKIFTTYGNGITPHMIRHYYATHMAKVDREFTRSQLGHRSINTTKNNYINAAYGMKDLLASM